MAAASATPSADLRRELWNARVEADMRQRYFARMAQRAHGRDRALRAAIFFTSSATGVTAVGDLGLGPGLFALATAILAAVWFTLELGSVAMKHAGFGVDWSRIHQEALDLWTESDRGGLSHDEVRASLRAIQRRIERSTSSSHLSRRQADPVAVFSTKLRRTRWRDDCRATGSRSDFVRAKQSIGHPPPPRPPKAPPKPKPVPPQPRPKP